MTDAIFNFFWGVLSTLAIAGIVLTIMGANDQFKCVQIGANGQTLLCKFGPPVDLPQLGKR